MKKSFLAILGLAAIAFSQVKAIDAAKTATSTQAAIDAAKQAASTRVEIQAEVQFGPLAVSLGQFDVIGTPQLFEPVVESQFVSPPGDATADVVVSSSALGSAMQPHRFGGASLGVTDVVSSNVLPLGEAVGVVAFGLDARGSGGASFGATEAVS